MTTPYDRWDEVKELFGDALEASPEDRERMLDDRALADLEVVREVRSLLASHLAAGERFVKPAMAALSDAGEGLLHPVASLEGQRLGPYVIGRKIGQGGMGAVYEAVRADDEYHHRVALKTISRGADSRAIVQRFRRERQILAGLQHPNIASLFDGGVTESGTPYFVMEYVDGLPIDAWCAKHHLTIAQRLDLFRHVCAAVQHAHRRLVVHRDIKPGNVLVSADGDVKLLDFGIAKLVDPERSGDDAALTDAGLMPLTTAYASPEQARGEPVSTATDVYSLGVVLYQLLSGVPPIDVEGKRPAQILAAVTDEVPATPSTACTALAAETCGMGKRERLSRELAGELDAIVMMAMRKEAERRYASVDALSDDVHRYLKGLPVSARPDTLGYRVRKFVVRRRAPVVSASLTIVVAAVFTSVSLWQSRQARLEAARTERISSFMQSVLGAADVSTIGGSLPRVGPRATVSALLDSAVRRVPQQFPDDPAVRARLYTTVGSSLITQSRLREASTVLDSAVRLARIGYGERSQEFALASIEAGQAAMHRNRLADARRLMTGARFALEGAKLTKTELYARALVELSSIALVEGDFVAMDSLAHRALSLENQRTTAPSMVKAVALNRLGSLAATRGKWARADSIYGQSLAVLDSLHAPFSLERIDVIGNLTSIAFALGNTSRADSLSIEGERQAVEVFGPDTREVAMFLRYRATVSLVRGDTALSRERLQRAVRIIDSIPDVVASIRYLVQSGYVYYLATVGRWDAADSLQKVVLADLADVNNHSELAEAHLQYGVSRAMLHDLVTSEEHILIAKRQYDQAGIEFAAFQRLLLMNLAAVYARQGKDTEAAPYLKLLAPADAQWVKSLAARHHAADSAAMQHARAHNGKN